MILVILITKHGVSLTITIIIMKRRIPYTGSARPQPKHILMSIVPKVTLLSGRLQLTMITTLGNITYQHLLCFEESHSEGDNIYAQRNFSIPLPYLFAGNSDDQVGASNCWWNI
jgi:hypothetical protein